MAWTPENSAIRLTKSDEEKIAGMDSEQIKSYMAELTVAQGFAVKDYYDPNVLLPTERADHAAPQVGRTIVLNGTKHVLIADSEAALAEQEANIYRTVLAQPAAAQQTEQPRNERGQFVEQPPVADDPAKIAQRAELELQFKRGDISAADYLDRSGAVDDYLAKRGVPIEDLQAAAQEKSDTRFQQSWADATETFIANHPEWVGGTVNRDLLGKIITENNLMDSDPLQALESAYAYAVENNLIGENPEATRAQKIAEAQTRSELDAALGRNEYSSSGLFNYR